MPKLSRKAKRARIELLVKYYQACMRLEGWRIRVEFHTNRFPCDNTLGTVEGTARAACTADPEYKDATLSFGLDAIDDDELASMVVHELAHIKTWPQLHILEHCLKRLNNDPLLAEWIRYTNESDTTALEELVISIVPPPGI